MEIILVPAEIDWTKIKDKITEVEKSIRHAVNIVLSETHKVDQDASNDVKIRIEPMVDEVHKIIAGISQTIDAKELMDAEVDSAMGEIFRILSNMISSIKPDVRSLPGSVKDVIFIELIQTRCAVVKICSEIMILAKH
ncbi:hypothetical protein Fcan01_06577 [Folsomia candida]|uniref:PhoU domain-containing protein n=1 Tax=Folsomia candida TaxID=158441 RepID=A0A226EK12_FOLCA|nr:hypothetical protein Fcan01_06577 [Folsomia candida]